MSVFLTNDEDPGDQVASNLGWSDFGAWVDTLDVDMFPHLGQLWEHGVTEPVSALQAELATALRDFPPASASALAVARAVAETVGDWADDDPAIIHN